MFYMRQLIMQMIQSHHLHLYKISRSPLVQGKKKTVITFIYSFVFASVTVACQKIFFYSQQNWHLNTLANLKNSKVCFIISTSCLTIISTCVGFDWFLSIFYNCINLHCVLFALWNLEMIQSIKQEVWMLL